MTVSNPNPTSALLESVGYVCRVFGRIGMMVSHPRTRTDSVAA